MSERFLIFLSRGDVWAVGLSLAGFLALFWLIRGAPIGQATREEPDEAPGAGYRDRVVAASVVGFLLVLAGAYLAAAVGIPWSIPAFAAGFGTVVAVLRANRRYRHASPTLRRVVDFSNTALTGSLVAGVLVVGNVLAFKYGGRAIDLTRDRAFSLSPTTIRQLQTLDRPLSFSVYFGNSERSVRQLDRVRQLLELYRAASPAKVRVDYLNPFTEAREFEELVKRVPDVAAAAGDGVVVAYGEGQAAPHAILSTRDLFEGPGNQAEARPDRFVTSFNGEDVITSAVTRLREGKRAKVAFTTGHDEPSTTDFDPGQPGVGLWRARLASVGSDVVAVNLLRDEVPEDVSLLVICGPRSPFQADEIGRIRAYIARGGPLMILVGGGGGEPSGLEDLLGTYNVAVGPGLAVDPNYNYMKRAFLVYAPAPAGPNAHPIAAPIAGRVALLQNASPLTILGAGAGTGVPKDARPANPGVIASPFLRTSSSSWAETDLATRPVKLERDRDRPGPLDVGVAVTTRPAIEGEEPVPRVVILSTPLVADNRIVAIEPANLDLLMNAVYWLRGKPELLGIGSKTHESLMFAADPGLQLRLVMVPTLMAAVVIIGLGVTTYLARRD